MTLALSRRGLAAAAIAVASAAHLPSSAHARTASDADARALIDLILENYAYQERLSGFSEQRLRLLRERDAPLVASASELITFGERALAALFDHHAILNSSLANSYGLVPSFADLWIESDERGRFAIQDVRHGSPALRSGVRPGDVLVGVEGALTDRAIAAFIEAPSDVLNTTQRDCCARVLAAGRRDRPRRLSCASPCRRAPVR